MNRNWRPVDDLSPPLPTSPFRVHNLAALLISPVKRGVYRHTSSNSYSVYHTTRLICIDCPSPLHHCLVPVPAPPPSPACNGSGTRLVPDIAVGVVAIADLLVAGAPASGTALEARGKRGEEEDDGGGEGEPDRVLKVGSARRVVVDLVADDTKHDKVDDHSDERDNECEERNESREEEPDAVGSKSDEEGNTGDT